MPDQADAQPDAATKRREGEVGAADTDDVEQALEQAQASADALKAELDDAAPGDPDDPDRGGDDGDDDEGSGEPSALGLPDFDTGGGDDARPIASLGDVDLDVTIELGRTEMLVEDVLKLGGGSVVELDKLAGDPVDVKVNGRLVARGEVLVLNDNFCIRISEIVANLEEEAEALQQDA